MESKKKGDKTQKACYNEKFLLKHTLLFEKIMNNA